MKKIQFVEFDEIVMESRTSSSGEVTLSLGGTKKKSFNLSAQEVIELRDWLNELTRPFGHDNFPSIAGLDGAVVATAVTEPMPDIPANPLDTPTGYIPLESRGRGAIILPNGQSKVVPFVSDGRTDASTVAHRIPLGVALKKAGMELYDKGVENPIIVNANKTPKGARGDGK